MGRKRKQFPLYEEPDAKLARADSEGDLSENGMLWESLSHVGMVGVSCLLWIQVALLVRLVTELGNMEMLLWEPSTQRLTLLFPVSVR